MNLIKRCEIWGFQGVKIQVKVFWIVTPCSVVVGHWSLHREDGGSMDLSNVDILPQNYTVSQPRRPRLEPH
jgi:hypothetical protein